MFRTRGFLVSAFFLAMCGAAAAAAPDKWIRLGTDREGEWWADTQSLRREGDYVKVTVRTRFPGARDIPVRNKKGEMQTVAGVAEALHVTAIDCSRRLSAVVAYSFIDENGGTLGGASAPQEVWLTKLKEPVPATPASRVVDAVCSALARASQGRNAPTPERIEAGGDSNERPAPRPASRQRATGAGVVVNDRGHILTNHHVVASCRAITVAAPGRAEQAAERVGSDQKNDLAVLRVASAPGTGALVRVGESIKSGEAVMAIGFPLHGLLAAEPNVSFGHVSATAGIANDTSVFQLSAPIHRGNSGGPVLDQSGKLVGLVSHKLNPAVTARVTGDLPQNVGFAIKSEVLQLFMNSLNVPFVGGSTPGGKVDNTELAARGRRMVVQVFCEL